MSCLLTQNASDMLVHVTQLPHTETTIVENLAKFYAYELSIYTKFPCPNDGLFFCRDSDFWRTEENRYFVFRVDEELAGFTIVDHVGANAKVENNVAEFLVLPKFRRQGVGGVRGSSNV